MGLLGNLVNKISPNLLTLANRKEGRLVSTIWVSPIAWATSKVANQTNKDPHTKILSLREIPLISRHRVYRKWSHQAPSSNVKPVGPTEVVPHHLACGTEDGQHRLYRTMLQNWSVSWRTVGSRATQPPFGPGSGIGEFAKWRSLVMDTTRYRL